MKWCEPREYKWNEYVTIAVNRNLNNCENSPKKVFRGFKGIRTRGLCVSAAVLSQLSYEDPYTGGWPIYWIHQPMKGTKHWMKWCELREYKWNEYVTIVVNRNLNNCENSPKKKFFGASNPVEAPKNFFSGYFRNCLNCDSLRWSHTHFKLYLDGNSPPRTD